MGRRAKEDTVDGAVARLQTRLPAGHVTRLAPTVFRPQATPKTAQPRMADRVWNRRPPVAPGIHRPAQNPSVLQPQNSSTQRWHTGQALRRVVGPPVYRPQAD